MATQQISYLVIGGCGFLGHHIVSQLLDAHATKVSVLDLRTENNRFPAVQYFNGDITSEKDVLDVLQKVKPAVLIHTASPVAIKVEDKALFDKVNVKGTENLLTCAARASSVKAFVFTSSSSVVHDSISDIYSADESYPVLSYPEQRSYYSHTKGVAEKIVLAANRKNGTMLTVAIRPAGIFGEGDAQMLPNLLNSYYTGKTKFQLGNNQGKFDTTYVGNVAHAHLLAARALLQTHSMGIQPLDHEKIDGETFFVTNDEPMPFWDFAHAVWKEAGWQGSPNDAWVLSRRLSLILATILEWVYWIVFLGTKQPTLKAAAVHQVTINRTFNIDKAKRRLGYMPLLSVKDGVKRGVKWFETQRKEKAKLEETKKIK